MSYNYAQFVSQLANMIGGAPIATDPGYLAALPNIVDDAENRCYRDLDLLSTIVRDQSATLSANNRSFTLPQSLGRFVVTESMNVFTPVGFTINRKQLVPASREFIDAVWPNEAAPGTPSVPSYYAPITDQQFIVGPSPDASYTMEVVGTIRPTPLSATNTTTYLSLYLPDLFLAASLVFAAGYQQNFSAMGDNPAQSVTWEAHYQKLLASANLEEARKRYASQAWTPKQPFAVTTPPRN
jgi:hypothetical protein